MSGFRKSFQLYKMLKMATVASAGFESGRSSDQYTWRFDAPSIFAASSRSYGIVMKNWRKRNTLNGPPPNHHGTVSGRYVLIQCSRLNRMYFGTSVTASGSISVESSITKRTPRPGNRMREK